jgi:regulator of sigma E protease
MTGVKVNEFALGMGPKLFGFTKGETQYTFRAIPFGGFCAMEGENEDSEDPRAFNHKPARVKALILFAGSIMNILLAIVLLSMIFFYMGIPTKVLATVDDESYAYMDGLAAGDELLSMNGYEITEWNDLSPILQKIAASEPDGNPQIILKVLRDGTEKTIETHLYTDEDGAVKLGVTPEFGRTPAFFFKSFGYGAMATVGMGKMMYEVLGDLFTGQTGVDQLTGPVGIFVIVGDMARSGMIYLVQLTALISLNLAIINLLPFPALDGGRLLFLLIRKVTGKAISDEVEGRVHLIGIIVLLAFMVFITFQDIDRFFMN